MCRHRRVRWVGKVALVFLLTGCASKGGLAPLYQDLTTDEVVEVSGEQSGDAPPTAAAANPTADGQRARTFLMDAMVGQVNGQAIYASTIFRDMEETLKRLGEELRRLAFRQRARILIQGKLLSIIEQRLVLGEAMRELSEQEEQYIQRHVLREIREELIREFGKGSSSVANDQLRMRYNTSLDEKLEEKRRELLVKRHMWRKVGSKISVSRRDVNLHYRDNIDRYETPPGRVLRMIKANDEESADRVDQMLANGEPFVEVSGKRDNLYGRDRGGLFSEEGPTPGNTPFAHEQLNQAMANLQPGEHSPRLAIGEPPQYFWVYVESQTEGRNQSLRDVQLDIQHELELAQLDALARQYRDELLANGSYSMPDQMTATLVEVAMNRYARPN